MFLIPFYISGAGFLKDNVTSSVVFKWKIRITTKSNVFSMVFLCHLAEKYTRKQGMGSKNIIKKALGQDKK